MEISDVVEKNSSYEYLYAVQIIPNDYIVIVRGNLNAKVGSDNTLPGNVMRKHGLGGRNDSGQMFLNFCSFHHLLVGGVLL